MRAFMVCVDYADVLAITLPRNRHHFSEVCIVTTPSDSTTINLAKRYDCEIHITNAFYDHGAIFNKWKALEEGLDAFGREQDSDPWLCLMDADIIWPKILPAFPMECGFLYTPLRRLMHDITMSVPPESDWSMLPLHRNVKEWAGYTQIFHCDDPALGDPPWHEVNWKHAGGADSYFQLKWPPHRKIRPPWECLHIGPCGVNWCGRTSKLADGTVMNESISRADMMASIVRQRRKSGNMDHEKL